jgi:hypothetical protein
MAEGLDIQVAIDSRLILENPTQIITTGAAQNLPRYVPATSVSGSQIQWNNILSIGNNVIIDPNWVVEYDVAVSFPKDGTGAQLPGVDYTANPPTLLANQYSATVTNKQLPTVVFAQFPLTRIANNLALQFNNVETSINASQLLNNCREWILDAQRKREMASSCPTHNYVSPNTVLSTAGNIVPNQPSTPYWACEGFSNASFMPISLIQDPITSANYVATYRLREPVFISPLTAANSAGLAQVQSINLRYNLDQSQAAQGLFSSAVVYTASQLSATITAANLYLDYLTVDTLKTGTIPPVVYYNFEFPEFQQTPLAGLSDTAAGSASNPKGASYQMTTQSQKLSTMPKWYYCKLSPNFQGLTSQNNLCGFPIEQMTITFGSFGQYIFNREQLWQCFKKNTGRLDITYPQWVALGTPVILQPAVDITSASDAFQGKTNDSGIMWQNNITYTLENYIAAAGNSAGATNSILAATGIAVANCYAYEVFVNSGSCQIGMGTCIFKNTTASEAEFSRALSNKDMVSSDALAASQGAQGGSFLSGLKGVLHTAKKVAGVGAKALQHPLAQKGLEYLASAGSGMSGGALSHSLRRRK